ncbi:MAG TPA: phosphotransferase family protein [Mycobacteriales bacterium]|nr:phosphotransferase family protein [Mycobacteriales bacterium]
MTGGDAGDRGWITRWLERDVGGRVVRIERQARWRPAWYVDLDHPDGPLSIYVRGDRLDSPSAFPLAHEMRFQSVLHREGIPVPRVLGWSDGPLAIAMERVPGRDSFDGTPDDERRTVMHDYVDALVRLHAIDVEAFSAADIVRAQDPAEAGLVGLRHFELVAYRALKKRPDPFLEFTLAWLARHRPDSRGRESAIVWDSGQFLHQDGRITAMIDLEFGHIGDPMQDLAGLWVRNPFLEFGDVAALLRRYEERSDTAVDLDAVQYHYILWSLSNQLEFHGVLAEPVPGADYMLNLSWCIETNLMALEGIATVLGVALPDVPEPEPIETGFGPAYQHLVTALEQADLGEGAVRYRNRMSVRLARHLARVDEIGTAVVAADLDDLAGLLGQRPASWADGEQALESFVLADNGQHDAELVSLFHRRLHRARMLNGPAGSWITQHRHAPQPLGT